MPQSRTFALISAIILGLLASDAANCAEPETLFSPSAGEKFYEIAYDLAKESADDPGLRGQALILFKAALTLDKTAKYILPEMIRLSSQETQTDRSELVGQLINSYISETADLEVLRTGITYQLDQLNSREERERLLQSLLRTLGGKSEVLDSELATLLGLLAAEKADFQTAVSHLIQAYNYNKYNKLAFEKIAELAPEQIGPATYLEHLRLSLQKNPVDMQTALTFAQACEEFQLYETAAGTYEYCSKLFEYLYPSEPPASWIYLPWAMSCYNTQLHQHQCLQIAAKIRQSGRFDLLLESIAAKAAEKTGDKSLANRTLRQAEDKAIGLVSAVGALQPQRLTARELAWFYCFVLPDADKAINWANRAYSKTPDSTGAVLAYALVLNGQTDVAETIVETLEDSQSALLTKARIQLARRQNDSAKETLKSAINADPGSFLAEKARQLLEETGGSYVPTPDPGLILTALRNSVGQTLEPVFTAPEKGVSVQLNVRGSSFFYDSNFRGSLVIKNNSTEPIIISDDGLITGEIKIDANITGDIDRQIPDVVSMKIGPSLPIKPGRSISVPVQLVNTELRRLLSDSPQASLEIEFTAYLDPVTTADGLTANRIAALEPGRVKISRSRVELSGKYLQNQFDSLSRGQQGQKIKAGRLFAGLLKEQQKMAGREPDYSFLYDDWMPQLLKSALVTNLSDDDWVIRVQTMGAMLSLPLDFELTSAVAAGLNDPNWPVRMMAIYLLAQSRDQAFTKVLDWKAQYDPHEFVREMATALGGTAAPQQSL